jgi:chemotaxis signal transduction protein
MAQRKRIRSDVAARDAARRSAILEERAARLAGRAAAPEPQRPAVRVLVCAVGANLFGLPLGDVAKVTRFERWGAAPAQHPALLGLVADEGRIRPAFDLATLVGAPEAQVERNGWLVALANPLRAAMRVGELPTAADVERLDEDAGRARVLGGEHQDKLIVILSARELLAANPSSSHGAHAP